jgi:hypothetical protein
MRLYLKAFALLCAMVALHLLLPSAVEVARDARFATNCWLAYVLDDAALKERMIAEAEQFVTPEPWEPEPAPTTRAAATADLTDDLVAPCELID